MTTFDYSQVPAVITLTNVGTDSISFRAFGRNVDINLAPSDVLKILAQTSTELAYWSQAAANNKNDSVSITVAPASAVLSQAATVAANATATATDLTSAEALANSLQTSVNAILSSLKAAKLMA